MDISLRTKQYFAEDRSWLGSRDGTEVTQGVTLKTSAFTAGTHYPNGYVPSGTVLAQITASKLYAPYNNALTNGQEVAVGFLWSSVEMRSGGPDVGAPLMWRGVIKESRLPANSGLDSAAKTDFAAKFRFQ